jgi:hypothetical protein
VLSLAPDLGDEVLVVRDRLGGALRGQRRQLLSEDVPSSFQATPPQDVTFRNGLELASTVARSAPISSLSVFRVMLAPVTPVATSGSRARREPHGGPLTSTCRCRSPRTGTRACRGRRPRWHPTPSRSDAGRAPAVQRASASRVRAAPHGSIRSRSSPRTMFERITSTSLRNSCRVPGSRRFGSGTSARRA